MPEPQLPRYVVAFLRLQEQRVRWTLYESVTPEVAGSRVSGGSFGFDQNLYIQGSTQHMGRVREFIARSAEVPVSAVALVEVPHGV